MMSHQQDIQLYTGPLKARLLHSNIIVSQSTYTASRSTTPFPRDSSDHPRFYWHHNWHWEMGSHVSTMQSRLGTVASAAKSKSQGKARNVVPHQQPNTVIKDKHDSPQSGSSVSLRSSDDTEGSGGMTAAGELTQDSWIPEPRPISVSQYFLLRLCSPTAESINLS